MADPKMSTVLRRGFLAPVAEYDDGTTSLAVPNAIYAPASIAGNLLYGMAASLSPYGERDDGSTGARIPPIVTEPYQAFNRLMSSGYDINADPEAKRRAIEDAFIVSGAAMTGGGAASLASRRAPNAVARGVAARPEPPSGLAVAEGPGGSYRLTYTRDGQAIGEANLLNEPSMGGPIVEDVRVDPAFRRQGIGTEIHDAADELARERFGVGIRPSQTQSDDGLAFWASRDPDALIASLEAAKARFPDVASQQEITRQIGRVRGGDISQRPGIRAYHGSPHDFDRFDMSKIGTGEGAQAYGHGLYFAENEGVARSYRDALSKPDRQMMAPRSSIEADVQRALADYVNEVGWDDHINLRRVIINRMELEHLPPEALDAFDAMVRDARLPIRLGDGRMYEVNINADPENFLDWDAPVSAQPESVRRTLADLGLSDNAKSFNILQGVAEQLRTRGLMDEGRDLGMQVSETLRDAGIPGIRYLDQGSRGAGEGSRNFVVFDDELIDLIRKYGLAGMLGGGGYFAQDGEPSMSNTLRRGGGF